MLPSPHCLLGKGVLNEESLRVCRGVKWRRSFVDSSVY
jgi:hypothetical protein